MMGVCGTVVTKLINVCLLCIFKDRCIHFIRDTIVDDDLSCVLSFCKMSLHVYASLICE